MNSPICIVCEEPAKATFPIRPAVIRTRPDGSLCGQVGSETARLSAGRLVKFFQYLNYWVSFTKDQLIGYYLFQDWVPETMFDGLLFLREGFSSGEGEFFIYDLGGGLFAVSDAFIKTAALEIPRG
ncbi:MAG: hypothetical protein AB203_03460 [Parcubacteria bacterium C7867-008]|nr:MAG: hypothetical protein AB203_03460 [Parcubacteria bacterium C7867-008]